MLHCPNADCLVSLSENDAVAYKVLYKIGESLPSDTTGVMIIPSLDCCSERTDDTINPWWKDLVKDVCIRSALVTDNSGN